MNIPTDEFVANGEIEHRVADCDQTDELVVVGVPYKIPEPAAVSIGHWYGPSERCESEQVRLPSAGDDPFQYRRNGLRVYFAP